MESVQTLSRPERTQELAGNVAIVTGGARGLGEAISTTLCEAGATVIIADIREEQAEETAACLREPGGTAYGVRLDVTSEADVRRVIDRTVQTYGRLDIVVNNAGINITLPVEELSVQDWDRILAVNLRAPFVVSKAAFPHMRKNGAGHIVNIVSTAAKRAWANAAAYHASKWGLLGFSHALHVEARKQGIKVTAVIAGGMRTPFLLEPFPDIDVNTLQDPMNVARAIRSLFSLPPETVIPEVMVLPMRETSWP